MTGWVRHLDTVAEEPRDLIGDVQLFHDTAEIKETWPHTEAVLDLRCKLLEEETKETAKGFGYFAPKWERIYISPATGPRPPDLVEIADGHLDTIYIAIGSLLQLFNEDCARDLWAEVQRANMAKFPDGKVIRRADGKILKPEGWTPPDIAGVLRKHGYLP